LIFYYLDASAWIKRYYAEEGTAWVQGVFAQKPVFACASLGLIEVTATLSRKRKAHEITYPQFMQKIVELEDDWGRFIQIQMTEEVVSLAKELTKKLFLRGADSVHMASALILQKRFEKDDDRLIIIASDNELKAAARTLGIEVTDPIDEKVLGKTL